MSSLGILAALVLVSAGGVSPARGAEGKPPPVVVRGQPGPIRSAGDPSVLSPGQICQLGETRTSVYEVSYIDPPDLFYTLLRASSCPICVSPDTLEIKTAHVVLSFPVQCVVRVAVSIVGVGGTAMCPTPDTTVVLCPQRVVDIEPTSSGRFDLTAQLSGGCRITGNAFLGIKFLSFGPACAFPVDEPRLVFSAPDTAPDCPLCESYNVFGSGSRQDLCQIGFPGKPTMYADGELCVAVPALPTSWGRLKILYR